MSIINECYKKSIELLLNNSSDYGFLASSKQKRAIERNYLSIFARDASICALGAISSGNKKLILSAKKSLKILAKSQVHDGEIPNYVKPEKKYADFWRLGSIDATLRWLIAVDFYDKNTADKKFKRSLNAERPSGEKIKKAINWLYCQENENDNILIQTEASDWADLMPRNGKVLYTNALWYKIKKDYNLLATKKTKKDFNLLFYPYNNKTKNLPKSDKATIEMILKRKSKGDFYFSFVGYTYWGKDIDVYGNSLALLFDLPTRELKNKIIKYLLAKKRLKNLPMPVLFNPIKENSNEWRKYMESHKQNYPYQYHNGGIWPYASAFWTITLASAGQKQEAKKELEKIAYANSLNNWEFNEWFHAKTGEARGMKWQSWNAGAFLLAWHYLNGDVIF